VIVGSIRPISMMGILGLAIFFSHLPGTTEYSVAVETGTVFCVSFAILQLLQRAADIAAKGILTRRWVGILLLLHLWWCVSVPIGLAAIFMGVFKVWIARDHQMEFLLFGAFLAFFDAQQFNKTEDIVRRPDFQNFLR
jgi:hypothetical protein